MAEVALAAGPARFDLDVPAHRWLYKRTVREVTVMQSLAFDDANGWLYVAQLIGGGRRLPGETAPVSGGARAAAGDLCVSRLGYDGRLLAWMYLRRFGHGVAFGAEPAGRETFLWVECNPTGGYGTAVARVRFIPSGLVTWPSAALEAHTPVPGSTENTVSLDALHRTLLVRHRLGGQYRYRLYGVDAFRGGDYTPLAETAEAGIADVFQGHAHAGTDVYRIEGRSGGHIQSPTFLSCQDLETGEVVQRSRTNAASSLAFREPQGLAVQYPGRLHLGLADGPAGARTVSVYYKPRHEEG